MRLGIDLDGCMYDFVSDYHDYIVRFQGVPREAIKPATHWNFYEDYGFTTEDFLRHLTMASAIGDIFVRREPTVGAVEALNLLRADGHSIHIATDRGRFGATAVSDTYYWLNEYKVPYDSVTFSQDKTVLAVDLMVEDAPMNLEALSAAGIQTVRYHQRWNLDVSADWYISTWDQLPTIVRYASEAVAA